MCSAYIIPQSTTLDQRYSLSCVLSCVDYRCSADPMRFNVGPASATSNQYCIGIGSTHRGSAISTAHCARILMVTEYHSSLSSSAVGPSKTALSPNAVSMAGQRLRRWANIETLLGEWHLFVGLTCCSYVQLILTSEVRSAIEVRHVL